MRMVTEEKHMMVATSFERQGTIYYSKTIFTVLCQNVQDPSQNIHKNATQLYKSNEISKKMNHNTKSRPQRF